MRPLIVILLILLALALLSALVTPGFAPHETSKRTRTIADLQGLKNALRTFENDTHRLPTEKEGLDALAHCPPNLTASWNGPYFDRISDDRWGNPYRYQLMPPTEQSKDHPGFNISSAGKDGQFGTDDDVDIYTDQ